MANKSSYIVQKYSFSTLLLFSWFVLLRWEVTGWLLGGTVSFVVSPRLDYYDAFHIIEPLSAAYLNKTEFLVEPAGNAQLCSAFWASPQVQLGCGVMMAHFYCCLVFIHFLYKSPGVSSLWQILLLHFWCCVWFHVVESKTVDTFFFFYLYGHFRFLRV